MQSASGCKCGLVHSSDSLMRKVEEILIAVQQERVEAMEENAIR